jgi:hypothetical protein
MIPAVKFGKWSAIALLMIGIFYLITGVIGIFFGGRLWPPRQVDPWLAIMEWLLLISVPFMILLMLAIHACSHEQKRIYSLSAVSFMIIASTITITIHFLQLTILRRENNANVKTAVQDLFLYADLLAWDLFFGLSLFLASFIFYKNSSTKLIFRSMFITGCLCVVGFLGPATGFIQLQALAILGYTVSFMWVCFLLAKFFSTR